MNIDIIPAYDHPEDVRALFTEYTNMLIEGDSSFAGYLVLQNYDDEILHLEHKYGMPFGRLYLIRCDGETAGCIALRKIDNDNCEMKRLYVKPQFRGHQLSRLLIDKLIEDAKAVGYKAMLLDTLPFLQSAIRIYKEYGFYEIPSYNNSPMDTTIYMKLDL